MLHNRGRRVHGPSSKLYRPPRRRAHAILKKNSRYGDSLVTETSRRVGCAPWNLMSNLTLVTLHFDKGKKVNNKIFDLIEMDLHFIQTGFFDPQGVV